MSADSDRTSMRLVFEDGRSVELTRIMPPMDYTNPDYALYTAKLGTRMRIVTGDGVRAITLEVVEVNDDPTGLRYDWEPVRRKVQR